MSLRPTVNLRRIFIVFLAQVILFLGLNFGLGNTHQALAQTVKREIIDTPSGLLDESQIEEAKEKRREAQAQRSEKAAEKRSRKFAKEDLTQKLNLDESLPKSTEKFIEQIKGEEGIDNETHPQDN